MTSFFPAGGAEAGLLSLADGTLVHREDVVLVQRRDPPRGVTSSEKWIDVDLATQTLTAYEGTEPVFATLQLVR